jgi:hypothetical protein
MKETIIICAVIVSIVLMIISLNRIEKSSKRYPINRNRKRGLTYLSIILPIVGFIVTMRLKK